MGIPFMEDTGCIARKIKKRAQRSVPETEDMQWSVVLRKHAMKLKGMHRIKKPVVRPAKLFWSEPQRHGR